MGRLKVCLKGDPHLEELDLSVHLAAPPIAVVVDEEEA